MFSPHKYPNKVNLPIRRKSWDKCLTAITYLSGEGTQAVNQGYGGKPTEIECKYKSVTKLPRHG